MPKKAGLKKGKKLSGSKSLMQLKTLGGVHRHK